LTLRRGLKLQLEPLDTYAVRSIGLGLPQMAPHILIYPGEISPEVRKYLCECVPGPIAGTASAKQNENVTGHNNQLRSEIG
jgi:hypothetical protein